MKPILEVQGIGKRYDIRHQTAGYLSLRERMQDMFRTSKGSREEFWALKDVSFEVQAGESLGIIGRNGAGKSTLLKILSKITPPTTGRFIARGRIASLLEVGTGFHPELTGRENIFFNGSLLGMKRREIEAKFDEIVDFSGVERFLDTPLKHYSSGMQLRLAFAVAAFLEPEILIIDEVLAVGDAEFQKKCIGKMEDVSKSGRTILFVSHNLDEIERLCTRSILVQSGTVGGGGSSRKVVGEYLGAKKKFEFEPVALAEGTMLHTFYFPKDLYSGDELQFELAIARGEGVPCVISDLSVLFYNYKQQRVAIYDLRSHPKFLNQAELVLVFKVSINCFNLIEGDYSVGLFYGINGVHADKMDLAYFHMLAKPSSSLIHKYDLSHRGFVNFN